jgi:DNA repair protein RecN (Recombination protein N)
MRAAPPERKRAGEVLVLPSGCAILPHPSRSSVTRVLTHLRITAFAILDDVELSLGPGLTVLSGETGAGKSLIVEAVALLRGGRASAEVVRTGVDEAQVEAVFEGDMVPALRERLAAAGIPVEEQLLVRRVVARSGRSRVYLNGVLATAAQLAGTVGSLIDLAGQHEHQTLCDVSTHLGLLDAFAGLGERVRAVGAAHDAIKAVAATLEAAATDERTRLEREDFLRYQLQELDGARLRPGEPEELGRERERLRSAGRLQEVALRGEERLYAREGSVCDELSALTRELGPLVGIDPALEPVRAELDRARVGCEEAARELRRYADRIEADPERLAAVEDRLDAVARLLRKHGPSVEEALARQAAMATELAQLAAHEERRAAAAAALAAARAEAARLATALSTARAEAARELGRRAERELRELGMKDVRVALRVEPRAPTAGDPPALVFDGSRLGARGWDRAELLLAPNPGEDPRPLARIASGGELSRAMLGLRQVLAATDPVDTYVFDEVDAGIGGVTGDVVGRKLREVARRRQVLCITHLAQIAAYADSHVVVEKQVRNGRTQTRARRLEGEERVGELARMIGGTGPTARAHAVEMLRAAQPAPSGRRKKA